jgi:transcriptional regulator with XRE-family HTH domain
MVSPRQSAGGALIREARLRAGISQRELAGRLGTSQSLVARWESGRVAPSFDAVLRSIRACGFELDYSIATYDHEHDLHIAENRKLPALERVQRVVQAHRALDELTSLARQSDG